MTIDSTELINKGVQANGNTLYQIRLTDHLGVTHIIPSRSFAAKHDMNTEVELRKAQKEEELARTEVNQYMEDVRNNLDPFGRTPEHISKEDMKTELLKEFDKERVQIAEAKALETKLDAVEPVR